MWSILYSNYSPIYFDFLESTLRSSTSIFFIHAKISAEPHAGSRNVASSLRHYNVYTLGKHVLQLKKKEIV